MFLIQCPYKRRISQHPQSFGHCIDMFESVLVLYPLIHHYGSLVNVNAIFVTCKCSCSSSSCHQHPLRSPMSIMLETWLLFRQAISVEAAFSWTKSLNHNPNVLPFSLQGKCSQHVNVLRKRNLIQTTLSVNLSKRIREEYPDN